MAGNKMAGHGYHVDPWYKGLPREPGIRTIKLTSDVLSPLYTSYFDHTYHSATPLMPESAVHFYKYDNR